MKKLFILFILSGTTSCSTVKTGFDYDREVDFSTFKTYNFTEDNLEETAGRLNRTRILSAVEKEMAAKGYSKSDNQDVLVNVYLKSHMKVNAASTFTDGNYDEHTEGTLFISMVDNSSQKIVWQGNGTKVLVEKANADKQELIISYSIQQILMNYPPEQ